MNEPDGGEPDTGEASTMGPAASAGGRIRARPAGLLSPVTRLPIFRIEDAAGRVLRRIGSARDPGEAIAHYWRSTAADARLTVAMSDEPPADAALRRRIDLARAARGRRPAGRDAMLTHELPLPGAAEPDVEPAAPPRRQAAARRRPAAKPAEQDLFATSDEAASEDAEPAVEVAAAPEPVPNPESEPEPLPEPVPGPELAPASGGKERRKPEPAPRTAYHLDPGAVPMQPVDYRNLRSTDRADSYLYHVTNRTEANGALRNGLVVSAQDPIILSERPGVAYWLSVLAEDYDVILDGPADFVVLRIRRHAVDELLEPDPDASRSAGCACYLLTGGGHG